MNMRLLKNKILEWGASLVSFADLKGLLPESLTVYHIGIAIAKRLSNVIIEEIQEDPTPSYAHHYRELNRLLSDIANKATNLLQSMGGRIFSVKIHLPGLDLFQ